MSTSPQLEKWRGGFGDAYVDRNPADTARLRASTAMWARVLAPLSGSPPHSFLEVGANVGSNLRAIRNLSDADLWAVEPNARARKLLADSGLLPNERIVDAVGQSIPLPDDVVDMAFTCGVLIHIAPDQLLPTCREIHRCARRYIGCIEYFSDQPETKSYRGESDLLFKRDFGSFWLDNFPDLTVIDCGFNWRRTTGLDNTTFWIFEKAPRE